MSVKDNFSVAATLSQLRYLVFQGMKGDTGDSAYEEAVKLGFVGTEEEWIASLKGETGANGRDGQDGAHGVPGRDGVSPTVQTEPITGGHRVTITDADGAHTFDVMDGEGGSGSGAVDSVNGKTGVVVLDASDVGALPDDTQIPSKTSELQNDSGFVTAQQAAAVAPVQSVNGQTGVVVLDAADVHALPDSTVIPPTVTEQTVSGWGFTKNTGDYSKPSGGIPKSDLATDVQASLGKADTALQDHQSLAAYRTASAQDTIDSAQNTAIAAKYTKPSAGIPKTDLAADVQTSLGKADTALQQHQSLTGYATETWVEGKGYLTLADLPIYNGGVT